MLTGSGGFGCVCGCDRSVGGRVDRIGLGVGGAVGLGVGGNVGAGVLGAPITSGGGTGGGGFWRAVGLVCGGGVTNTRAPVGRSEGGGTGRSDDGGTKTGGSVGSSFVVDLLLFRGLFVGGGVGSCVGSGVGFRVYAI